MSTARPEPTTRWPAIREARLWHARLTIVHCYPLLPTGGPWLAEGEDTAVRAVQALVARHTAELDGVQWDTQVRWAPAGSWAHKLVDAAEDADLLVVGSRGLGGFWQLLLGSVSHHVSIHASSSVAVVHDRTDATGDPSGLVVGIDGSPPSLRALAWAAREAHRLELPVEAVHAYAVPTAAASAALGRSVEEVEEIRTQAHSVVATCRRPGAHSRYCAAVSLELTPVVVVVVGVAAFLIGLSKGGVGGGIGPLITILVAVIVTPSQAIGVLLPLLMIGDLAAVWVHRADWDRHIVARLLPAATAGVVVASLFLRQTSDRGIEIFLAVLSVAFVIHRLIEPKLRRARLHAGTRLAVTAGVTSGVTSTVAHAGGPPVAIYLLAAQTPPVTFVATTAVLFFAINWLKVPGYMTAGLLDVSMIRVLPFALLIWPGVAAGRWLVQRVPATVFERVILTLLVLGAVRLLLG